MAGQHEGGPLPSPFDASMGATLEAVAADRVVAVLPVTPHLHQPAGIVHGGVYCSLVELAASVGANTWLDDGRVAVGVSNHTDFLRAVRSGTLRAEAAPLQRGRTLQLWAVEVTDERDRLVAHGRVRLANIDASASPTDAGAAGQSP